MLGIFLHDLWLVNATIVAVLAALASLAVMAGLSLGLAPFVDRLFGGLLLNHARPREAET
jgi:hypothetical protein